MANISIVVDNPKSWFVPFAEDLKERLQTLGKVKLMDSAVCIPPGNDIAFLLSCENKVPLDILARSRTNIVVHASELPKGKGMSPLTWQILEGKNRIPVTLFEAVEAIDAGQVYLRDHIDLMGFELLPEIHRILGLKIIEMCVEFISEWPAILASGVPQSGESTYYKKRSSVDSRLDPSKSIADQFNLFRVVDNEKYPAYFELFGRRYILKIESAP
jgi:methionyl-tRNA formyltransferase